jgi:hypothetical protein
VGKQHPGKKSPLSGIAVNEKKPLLYGTNRKSCDHEISIKRYGQIVTTRLLAGKPQSYFFMDILCDNNLKLKYHMKMIADSIRHFFEGFASFYTSLYDEMKRW